jgi:hypothetical protein
MFISVKAEMKTSCKDHTNSSTHPLAMTDTKPEPQPSGGTWICHSDICEGETVNDGMVCKKCGRRGIAAS